MTFGHKSKPNICLLSLKYVEGFNGEKGEMFFTALNKKNAPLTR